MVVEGSGGVKLAVRVQASSARAPGLLLHHGLASSSHIWDLMLPRLSKTFRVVAFDARGHGESGKPGHGYAFDSVSEDARAVAKATRTRRPVLVGHSWGAMVALEIAARRPRWLAAAVLVDGGLVPLGSHMDWATTKRVLAPPPLDGMPVAEFLANVHRWAPVPVTPAIEGSFLSLMRVDSEGRIHRRLSEANHLRILRAIWEQRPIELYARLRVPTFVILARSTSENTQERAFADAKSEALADARRVARDLPVTFSWMDGVHDLPIHRPAALARRIERFWEKAVR